MECDNGLFKFVDMTANWLGPYSGAEKIWPMTKSGRKVEIALSGSVGAHKRGRRIDVNVFPPAKFLLSVVSVYE